MFKSKRHVYQQDKHRYFYLGINYSSKSGLRINAENCNSYCNNEFKIITSGSEGHRCRFFVSVAHPFGNKKSKKHGSKINGIRYGYPNHI